MSLSVIITTSPGRAENLWACLNQLQNQVFKDFEVLICNDGAEDIAPVLTPLKNAFNLRHLWRPSDGCPARSRNQGVQAAQFDKLVFLDGDMLLNPQALSVYDQLLEQNPRCLWAGYYGNIREYSAPSLLAPDRHVNYLDQRMALYSRQILVPSIELQIAPDLKCWSGSLATTKGVMAQLNGFDEAFVGWGGEDGELALRALQNKIQIHFSLDVWGEHQIHPVNEAFHQQYTRLESSGQRYEKARLERGLVKPDYAVQVQGSTQITGPFCQQIFSHYIPQTAELKPPFKAHCQQFDAQIVPQWLAGDTWELKLKFPDKMKRPQAVD